MLIHNSELESVLTPGSAMEVAIAGTPSADTLIGTPSRDRIIADAGDDWIAGNQGSDTLNGNLGQDLLYGGQDSDLLHGGQGNDTLHGDRGSDRLSGDLGSDLLIGGEGQDIFILSQLSPENPTAADWILDFEDGQDYIQLQGGLTSDRLIIALGTDNLTGTTLIQDLRTGQTLAILPGIHPNQLTAEDFISDPLPSTLTQTAQSESPLLLAAPQTPSSFNIEFDYRFDHSGFFNDPNRRQILETAASFWERHILDEFTDLAPGTPIYIKNPTTGGTVSFSLDRPIDDILVFVGTAPLASQTIAQAGPSAAWTADSDLDIRFNSPNFEPWTGHISFNSTTNWFIDPTPHTHNDIPPGQVDLMTVATHELGHILGIGNTQAFNQWISGQTFMGPNALVITEGLGVPLAEDLSHIEDHFLPNGISGESLLDPMIPSAVRQFPTRLDLALLQDIGYQIIL
ncbi:M10 family metallopeptidase C-terminal domain-containing protein [Roseofilum capinflatum]|uniref:Peptidase M10 serralysin C-terminal domain-containing protein n=1 Tax=Roseofilum capinflatum BLCC-M114 TaxID=3022440 RepID=A0ABT7BB36_9CYAN|nr:hypothetical protein [Roseofilum capinflatum]MDJ1175523.1 hypothetical protein [Roseofilum capinflatum BLCC-M114]